jgi:hypothetical protein
MGILKILLNISPQKKRDGGEGESAVVSDEA